MYTFKLIDNINFTTYGCHYAVQIDAAVVEIMYSNSRKTKLGLPSRLTVIQYQPDFWHWSFEKSDYLIVKC